MSKEDVTAQVDTPEVCEARRWTKSRVLLFGAILGMGIGILNVTAVAHEWTLARCFGYLDLPLLLLMGAAQRRFESVAEMSDGAEFFYSLVAIVCYWIVLGLLLAWVYSSARDGFIKKMVRDKTFRRSLFYGASGGVLVFGLHFLAADGGWGKVERLLKFMDQPARRAIATIYISDFGFLRVDPHDPINASYVAKFVYFFYWVAIGLLVSLGFYLVCVIRKRKETDVVSATGPGGTVERSKFP